MDPQKLPNPNSPEDAKKPSPTDAANDVSMSEESSVAPGTVVVGGPANPDTDMGPKPPEVPTESAETEPTVPTPDGDQSNIAEFMREPAGPSEVPPAPPKGKKTGLIVGIIAAVLVVFGAGAAAYFAFMKPDPDKVLQAALVNTFSNDKVQSVGFEGEIAVTDTASDTTYTMDFTGASDQNGALTFTGDITIPMLTPITLDARSTDGKTLYLKASGLADLNALLQTDPSTAAYVPLLASLDNQWYKIDPSLLEQFGGPAPTASTSFTDADRQKLADAYTQNPFLAVQETLDDQTIAGVDSYHYKVGIDGVKLKAFVSAVEAANIESLGLIQPLLDVMKSGADVDFSKYPLDVWIAKDSKLFTQFSFKMQDNEALLDMTLTLKDYNKLVTVEEPTDAEPIMNALTSFYQVLGASVGSGVPNNLLQ